MMTFSKRELNAVVRHVEKEGVAHFHLVDGAGGAHLWEPPIRTRDGLVYFTRCSVTCEVFVCVVPSEIDTIPLKA
jgi:hypothetical protein